MKITSHTIWFAVPFPLEAAIDERVLGTVGEAVLKTFDDPWEDAALEVFSNALEAEVLP